jgi:hypothetical protein
MLLALSAMVTCYMSVNLKKFIYVCGRSVQQTIDAWCDVLCLIVLCCTVLYTHTHTHTSKCRLLYVP